MMGRRGLAVSVAIPCYNADNYIQKALDSIYCQTVVPDEILVVDDGSTDSTAAVLKYNSKVRLIAHKENQGIAGARNSALAAALGDVIAFIDADGIADPHYIEKLLVCYSDERVGGVGGKGIEVIQNNSCDRWRKDVLFQHWGDRYCEDVAFLFGLCSSYRKNALNSVNGFDCIFKVSGEDMDIGFRLHDAGYKLIYSSEAIVYHQRSDNLQSIKKMAYRHCLYGFLAQRRNNNFTNKVSTLRSFKLYFKHIFSDGLLSGSISYALLSTQLHLIMAKAWVDSIQLHKKLGDKKLIVDSVTWEGHGHS